MRLAADYHLRQGRGLTARQGLFGRSYNALNSPAKWRHPWWTTVEYSSISGQWSAVIKPGYVNEECPVYRTDTREQVHQGRDFGINPLTGQPYFSSFVFTRGEPAPTEVTGLDIPLYLSPAIPLTQWRFLGYDSAVNDSVPLFFQNLGVVSYGATETPDPRTTHLLRAVDLILHQPREALTATISFEPGPLTGTSLFRQVLTTRFPVADDVLRVYSGTYRLPDQIDPLSSTYEEEAWDELKIATVYLMSPAGAAPGSLPDGTWRPFVAHELFWPVGWIPAPLFRPIDITSDPNPLIGLTPLVGGLAAPIINTFAASANDAAQMALNMITAKSQAGTWWTVTGGGHVATTPLDRPSSAVTGLRAAQAWRAAQALAAAQARAAMLRSLDPPFPYRAIGFPRARLTAVSA